METYKHGLSIGIHRIDEEIHLTLKAVGKLTHEDYKTITPMLENALESLKNPKIKAFVDCSQLDGWELQAAWDDLKLGLKHGNQFEKIAILTNKNWMEVGSKIASWFIQGEIKTFEEEKKAIDWLNG